MKKLFKLLIFMFFMYILFQFVFNFFSKGHEINYKIKNENEFFIKEKRVNRTKNEIDNYYFEIKVNNSIFSIQTFDKLNNSERVIKDIKYFKDDIYECILPITKNNKVFSDIVCKKNNDYYMYNTIKFSDQNLDEFASNIKEYDSSKYIDSDDVSKKDNDVTLYSNLDNQKIGLEYYKGVYIFSPTTFLKREIFNKDKYNKELSGYINGYYFAADYNEEYEFHDFYIVNLKSNELSRITSNNKISMYSYVQGIVNDNVYIFDTANKRQYELNIKKKYIKEIGNEQIGIKNYINKEFIDANIYDAINNKMYFNYYETNSTINNVTYDKVDLVGNELSGYYYMYERTNGGYNVYRSNVQNVNIRTYLFKTSDISNVVYDKEFIYFKDGMYIKYYSDLIGLKKIIKYNEVTFNLSLKFGISR